MNMNQFPGSVRIPMIFFLFGLLWIVSTDYLLGLIFQDMTSIALWQTIKGWLFVFATTLLLFILLSRDAKAREQIETQYRCLFDASPEAMFILDQSGRFIEVNQCAVDRYGFSRAELLQMSVANLAAPGFSVRALASIQEQFSEQDGSEIEWQHQCKDGRMVDVEIRTQPVNWQGRPCLLRSARDITERKQAEMNLRESEDRYRSLVESASDAILLQTGGRFVYANPAFAQMFALDDSSQAENFPMDRIIPPENLAEVYDRIQRLVAGEPVHFPVEQSFIRQDESRFVGEVIASKVARRGDMTIQVVIRDITARKQAEEANRKLLEELRKANFRIRELAQQVLLTQERERHLIARELHDEAGQVLTAQKLLLQITLDDLPQECPELRDQVQEAVQLADQIHAEIRELAHLLRSPRLDDLGLNKSLAALCEDFSRRRGLEIGYHGIELPPISEMAALGMYRILQEALMNIHQHAFASQVEVKLNQDAEFLELVVVDNGIGVGELDFSKSSGMGLRGIQERLELLDGQFYMETRTEGGFCLTARIPVEVVQS